MIPVAELERVLVDMADGRGSELDIGGEAASLDVGAEELRVPLGPLLAVGTLAEWRKVLDRELADARPGDQAPDLPPPGPWVGDRTAFPILDSD